MKRNCLNLECGLKLFFLKILIGIGVIGGIVGISYAASSSDILTLKEAIDLGLKNSDSASKLNIEGKRLSLREEQLEASKLKHQVSSQLTASNNVSNIDNPDAGTSTQQLSLSYQLNFENGLLGKITTSQAASGLSSGEGETTNSTSATLTLSYPLYGSVAESTQLTNERSLLTIQSDAEILESDKASLQTQIANAFFAHVTQIEQLRLAREQLGIAQESLTRNLKITSQLTELNLLQFKLAVQQAQQELLARQVTVHQSHQQLANLIGKVAAKRLPRLDPPLALKYSVNQLEAQYLEKSGTYQELIKEIQIKQKDLSLSKTAQKPNIALNGDVGQSQTGEVTGQSQSIFLTLTYSFGGGQSEQTQVDRIELEQLNIDMRLQKDAIQLQAQTDFEQLQTLKALLDIRRQQTTLAEKQLKLAQDSFKSGRTQIDNLSNARVGLARSQLSLTQAMINYWQLHFQIWERTRTQALTFLP